jgi:hypothetical protein
VCADAASARWSRPSRLVLIGTAIKNLGLSRCRSLQVVIEHSSWELRREDMVDRRNEQRAPRSRVGPPLPARRGGGGGALRPLPAFEVPRAVDQTTPAGGGGRRARRRQAAGHASRLALQGIVPRLALGALAAGLSAQTRQASWLPAATLGASSAAIAAKLGHDVRARLARHAPDVAVAVAEDALALGAAVAGASH